MGKRHREIWLTVPPRWRQAVEKAEGVFHDHTAPWRCNVIACSRCAEKPTYVEYMSARFAHD